MGSSGWSTTSCDAHRSCGTCWKTSTMRTNQNWQACKNLNEVSESKPVLLMIYSSTGSSTLCLTLAALNMENLEGDYYVPGTELETDPAWKEMQAWCSSFKNCWCPKKFCKTIRMLSFKPYCVNHVNVTLAPDCDTWCCPTLGPACHPRLQQESSERCHFQAEGWESFAKKKWFYNIETG